MGMLVQCPKCVTTELKEMRLEKAGITVHGCMRCKGIWFDAGELGKVMRVAAKDFRVPSHAEKSERLCPGCGKELYTFHYPQTYVTVEMCKKCKGLRRQRGTAAFH